MKTVAVKKNTRDDIKQLSCKGESVDDTLNKILSIVLGEMPDSDGEGLRNINIGISQDTYDKLHCLKQRTGGTFDSTIKDALSLYRNHVE